MKQYIAGFLDADGTIGMAQSGHINVDFWNADVEILKRIKKLYGGTILTKKSDNPNHNTSYRLSLVYDKALNILKDVYPYMIHNKKRTRAELILKYYKKYTPRNGYYTPELKKKKDWLISEVKGIIMSGQGAYRI